MSDKSCFQKDYIKTKKLRARDACIKNLSTKTIDTKVINADTANIDNLNIKNISVNGQDLTCYLSRPAVVQESESFIPFGTTGSISPPQNVNPIVFDCLVQNLLANETILQERIFKGRTFINTYLENQGCPPTCPPPFTEPVPLEIYGILTLPIYQRRPCGPTGATGVTGPFMDVANTAVNFNLQVAYLLEVARSIDARMVSVLVQVGYVDPLGATGDCSLGGENVVIQEVFIANKQFYPTLDPTYGENFANVISIPINLLNAAYFSSPNPSSQGAIQMVIYKEEGLCIWTPRGEGFECLGGPGDESETNPPGGHQEQAFPPCPPGFDPFNPDNTNMVPCSATNRPL